MRVTLHMPFAYLCMHTTTHTSVSSVYVALMLLSTVATTFFGEPAFNLYMTSFCTAFTCDGKQALAEEEYTIFKLLLHSISSNLHTLGVFLSLEEG